MLTEDGGERYSDWSVDSNVTKVHVKRGRGCCGAYDRSDCPSFAIVLRLHCSQRDTSPSPELNVRPEFKDSERGGLNNSTYNHTSKV